MDIDLSKLLPQMKTIIPADIEQAGQEILDEIYDFLGQKYPRISLDLAERNLIELHRLKQQDDACRACVGWQSCPNPDLMMLVGTMTAGGWIQISHTYCPQNYRKPKRQDDETASDYAARKWGRKEGAGH